MASAQTGESDLNYGVFIGDELYLDGNTAALVEYAVAVENVEWDGVFMGDHLCSGEWIDEPQAAVDVASIFSKPFLTTSRWFVQSLLNTAREPISVRSASGGRTK